MDKFEIADSWQDGFVAGVTSAGINPAKDEHWQDGYGAGYRARNQKNQALNEYLARIGSETMDTVRLI